MSQVVYFDVPTGRTWIAEDQGQNPTEPATVEIAGFGWSGHDVLDQYPPLLARSNAFYRNKKGVGPLPFGCFDMTALLSQDGQCGPNVIVLKARPDVELYGRDGTSFRVHGRSVATPWLSSDGCIILPSAVRLALWASGVRALCVIRLAEDPLALAA